MKFSRDDEYEADQTGAEIMARAGYNPEAMATMFELLRANQGRSPGKLEAFFSSHPPAADREARIRQVAASLGPVQTRVVGGFETVQARESRLPAPRRPAGRAADAETVTRLVAVPVTVNVRAAPLDISVLAAEWLLRLAYTENWQTYPGIRGSLAPAVGVVTA